MTEAPSPETPSSPGKPFSRNVPLLSAALLAWCIAWMAAQTLLGRSGAGPEKQVTIFVGVSAAMLLGLFLAARKKTFEVFTSVPFAVVQMAFLALSVMLGTLLLQELTWPEYQQLYGGRWWGGAALFLVKRVHAHDLYHSLWFYGLLLSLSVSTLAVAWKRRPYPAHRIGFLLVHIAPSLVLLGGLMGKYGFVRAFNELHIGEPQGVFWKVKGPDPNSWKDATELPGFAVRLDKFEVEHYEPEFKLYAYTEPDGKGGFERSPKAYEVKEGLKERLPLTWSRFEVEKLLPNAMDAGQFKENPKAEAFPVLELKVDLGDGQPLGGYLIARSPRNYRFNDPGGRFAVLLQERFDPAAAALLKPRAPKAQKLVMSFLGKTLEHDAKPGDTWSFPAFELKVVALHPDFPFKTTPSGPVDLDRLPPAIRGPWAELKLHRLSDGVEEPLFLCARTPAFSDQANERILPPGMGMSLHYVREGEELQSRFAVFSMDDHKARLVENGQVKRVEDWVERHPFAIGSGASATPMALLPHAEWNPDYAPVPDATQAAKFDNPALKVKVTDPDSGKVEEQWLLARERDGSPSAGTTFLDGKVGLVYKERDTEPKDFRSVLVLQDPQGRELARKQVSVNDPLVYKGYWFYQSNYNPQDPSVSGIMVVREPGLPIVYLGFICLLVGSAWMFYLKPWLKRKAKAAEAAKAGEGA